MSKRKGAVAEGDREEELIPIIELGRALGFRSYAQMLDGILSGLLPARRIRGRWYCTKGDFERLVEAFGAETP